jgi:putative flippase GtrA
MRFLIVSIVALGINLAILRILVEFGAGKILAQAIAVVLVTPFSFSANKLWSFRR